MGAPVFVTMRRPDYHIDWDEVRRAVSGRTRVVVINSPRTVLTLLIKSARHLFTSSRQANFPIASLLLSRMMFDHAEHCALNNHD